MKQVLLVYGYGLKNAGDMAITLGAVSVLKNKGYKINLISRFDESHPEYERSRDFLKKYFADINIYPSPFRLNRSASYTKLARDHLSGGLTALGLKKNNIVVELLKETDLVVFNGGNLFRSESFTDFSRLVALMYPLRQAHKKGIPFIIFPQSASNINFWGKELLKSPLEAAEKIWCREDISKDYLKKTFQISDVDSSLDLAFHLNGTNSVEPERKNKIAITVRSHTVGDLGSFDEEKKDKITDVIIRSLIPYKEAYEFTFVIQTKKDIEITRRLAKKTREHLENVTVHEEYDPIKLIRFYRGCNVLLGMRLHSIILALSSGTPCVGFFDREWGFKNPGIMEQFELSYKYLNEEATTGFETEIQKVLDDEGSLRQRIKNYIKEEKNRLVEAL